MNNKEITRRNLFKIPLRRIVIMYGAANIFHARDEKLDPQQKELSVALGTAALLIGSTMSIIASKKTNL